MPMYVCRSVPRKHGMQSNLPWLPIKQCSRSLVMVADVRAAPAVLCASALSNDTGLHLGQFVIGTLPIIQ